MINNEKLNPGLIMLTAGLLCFVCYEIGVVTERRHHVHPQSAWAVPYVVPAAPGIFRCDLVGGPPLSQENQGPTLYFFEANLGDGYSVRCSYKYDQETSAIPKGGISGTAVSGQQSYPSISLTSRPTLNAGTNSSGDPSPILVDAKGRVQCAPGTP